VKSKHPDTQPYTLGVQAMGKEIGCVTIFNIVKRIGGKTLNSILGELSIWISTAIL
jgi:hypothetical protein